MRRIVYSVDMSLDGYIAGPNGEADWIVIDPNIDFDEILSRFDTLLMGRRTFEVAGGGGTPGMGMKTIVFSRTLRPADHPKVTVVADDGEQQQLLRDLRAQDGKDVWLFGGGELFRGLLDARQVDAVQVGVIPVLLGGGVPLLPAPARRATLKLQNSRVYPKTGTVFLDYTVQYAAEKPPKRTKRRREDRT